MKRLFFLLLFPFLMGSSCNVETDGNESFPVNVDIVRSYDITFSATPNTRSSIPTKGCEALPSGFGGPTDPIISEKSTKIGLEAVRNSAGDKSTLGKVEIDRLIISETTGFDLSAFKQIRIVGYFVKTDGTEECDEIVLVSTPKILDNKITLSDVDKNKLNRIVDVSFTGINILFQAVVDPDKYAKATSSGKAKISLNLDIKLKGEGVVKVLFEKKQ